MKNVFYFMLKVLFVLEIFTFLSCKKGIDMKAVVNIKDYEVTDWTKNNCNTHSAQHLKK